MSDIVERLHDKDGHFGSQYCKPHQIQELRNEAADEIERLEAEVARLRAALMALRNAVKDNPTMRTTTTNCL